MGKDKYEIWKMWDNVHDQPNQAKRISSAKKANMTPVSIDAENLCGEFAGSAKYHVTLDNCNCGDFRRRGLPCKHIYRLAIELGLLNESVQSDKAKIRTVKAERFTLSELVDKVEQLTDAQRILLRESMKFLLFTDKDNPAVVKAGKDCDALINAGFMVNDENVDVLFKTITRPELFERLERMGFTEIKRSISKKDLVEFAKENISDINVLFFDICALNLCTKTEGVQKKLYSYLLRRDCTEQYMDFETGEIVELPQGAMIKDVDGVNVVEFPDDEITQLLNKYGVNRCDNWGL